MGGVGEEEDYGTEEGDSYFHSCCRYVAERLPRHGIGEAVRQKEA